MVVGAALAHNTSLEAMFARSKGKAAAAVSSVIGSAEFRDLITAVKAGFERIRADSASAKMLELRRLYQAIDVSSPYKTVAMEAIQKYFNEVILLKELKSAINQHALPVVGADLASEAMHELIGAQAERCIDTFKNTSLVGIIGEWSRDQAEGFPPLEDNFADLFNEHRQDEVYALMHLRVMASKKTAIGTTLVVFDHAQHAAGMLDSVTAAERALTIWQVKKQSAGAGALELDLDVLVGDALGNLDD